MTISSTLSDLKFVPWQALADSQKAALGSVLAADHTPEGIFYPQNPSELGRLVEIAQGERKAILPYGAGSKLGWGGTASGLEWVVSLQQMNQLVDHAIDDLTVTVESGMKLADLQAILHQHGQFLPLDPAYPETCTIGGIVATANTRSYRHRYGGVRDLLLGISMIRCDGKLAKAGGRVVKNVAGYDLMKLLAGSYGTLGILTEMTLRVYPLPEDSATVVLRGEADKIAQAAQTLLSSALTPVAVDFLSTDLVQSLQLGQGLALMVRFASVAESVAQQSERLLAVGETLGLQGAVIKPDQTLWQQLSEQMGWQRPSDRIACKIGVLPNQAVSTLVQLAKMAPVSLQIHGGSGIGWLRFQEGAIAEDTLGQLFDQMRSFLAAQGGFLTVLEAPLALKQKLDMWGYSGNAIALMTKIKQQFDPQNILSPGRFVSGL